MEYQTEESVKVDFYLLGDKNVGKSTILSNFFQFKFKEDKKNSIEVYRCKLPFSKSLVVPLTFFDFDGTIELKKEFEKNSHSVFLLFFDVTSTESLKGLEKLKKFIPSKTLIFLVGNKMDKFLDEKDSEKRLLELHAELKKLKNIFGYFDYYLITKDDITAKRMFDQMIRIKILNKMDEVDFSETKIESDILVHLNDEIALPLHKAVLSISEKFREIFKEKNEINLDISEVDDFISFIDYLYLGKVGDEQVIGSFLKEYKIHFKGERTIEYFTHFNKYKQNYQIIDFLLDHFSIENVLINKNIELLMLSNFSNEKLSTLNTMQLFHVYKMLPPKHNHIKDNILIWMSAKVGPFDVEDLIDQCSKIQLQSRLLLDRCKLWMNALQITAGIALKMQQKSTSEESQVLSVSKEELEQLEIMLKESDIQE